MHRVWDGQSRGGEVLRRVWRAPGPLVLVVCVGCQAPLAKTVHEIEDGTPYAGDWELAVSEFLANDDLEEAEAEEASVIGTVAIAIEGGDDERPDSGGPAQSFLDLLGVGSRDEPQRLVIGFRWSDEFLDELAQRIARTPAGLRCRARAMPG